MRDNVLVLVNHLYEAHHVAGLAARFPSSRFVQLPAAPPWPDDIGEGEVLLFAGLRKPQLSALLQAAAGVRWIHTGSAGFDWVRVPEVDERDITLSRCADVMSIPIAEFVFGSVLAHAKHLHALREAQLERSWAPPMHSELHGKTMLVVGVGAIGGRVAGLARAFGMRVLGVKRDGAAHPCVDSMVGPDALDDVLGEADVVVLTAPGTAETEGMIGAAQLARMKPTSYLVNVARGSLIDDEALIAALTKATIAGACLDAFRDEPLPPDSPL
ncbi:MAG: D-2-hydroxyacid dehydrogenase, partial [Trueperaceae bacterium]|nr:D-2-hydroxyacid dehydrogenase [Trueperaceae bacterium]